MRFLILVVSNGIRLLSDLWVVCMRLPCGRSNFGTMSIFTFLVQGVLTFM